MQQQTYFISLMRKISKRDYHTATLKLLSSSLVLTATEARHAKCQVFSAVQEWRLFSIVTHFIFSSCSTLYRRGPLTSLTIYPRQSQHRAEICPKLYTHTHEYVNIYGGNSIWEFSFNGATPYIIVLDLHIIGEKSHWCFDMKTDSDNHAGISFILLPTI